MGGRLSGPPDGGSGDDGRVVALLGERLLRPPRVDECVENGLEVGRAGRLPRGASAFGVHVARGVPSGVGSGTLGVWCEDLTTGDCGRGGTGRKGSFREAIHPEKRFHLPVDT